MTAVYLTIDTEYAAGLAARGRAENFARSIACETPSGPAGLFYKMRLMDRHGIKGVFFVDPMPALLWGSAAIADVVEPIVAAGHDVQLQCPTEGLELAGAATPFGKTGQTIADFAEVIDGKHDDKPESAFYMLGALNEPKESKK